MIPCEVEDVELLAESELPVLDIVRNVPNNVAASSCTETRLGREKGEFHCKVEIETATERTYSCRLLRLLYPPQFYSIRGKY